MNSNPQDKIKAIRQKYNCPPYQPSSSNSFHQYHSNILSKQSSKQYLLKYQNLFKASDEKNYSKKQFDMKKIVSNKVSFEEMRQKSRSNYELKAILQSRQNCSQNKYNSSNKKYQDKTQSQMMKYHNPKNIVQLFNKRISQKQRQINQRVENNEIKIKKSVDLRNKEIEELSQCYIFNSLTNKMQIDKKLNKPQQMISRHSFQPKNNINELFEFKRYNNTKQFDLTSQQIANKYLPLSNQINYRTINTNHTKCENQSPIRLLDDQKIYDSPQKRENKWNMSSIDKIQQRIQSILNAR